MQQQHEPERKERFEDSCIRLKQKKKKDLDLSGCGDFSLFDSFYCGKLLWLSLKKLALATERAIKDLLVLILACEYEAF